MTVSEALQTRRSIRKFTDQPVDRELLESVLKRSQRAPSGGNTQPWHGIVLTGDPLQKLIGRIQQEFPAAARRMRPSIISIRPNWTGPMRSAASAWARICTARSTSPARRRANG